ncbi:myeloid differentiation primary response protein MyD88-like [Calliphora vicina]|uniref:myeloid differentiation primary response protein MyD88-like n=1 Tax=Calliphora vicina TaxID=7373 RepID=UPI00325BB14B
MVHSTTVNSTTRDILEYTQHICKEFANPAFKEAPLTALSKETLKKLSNLLNNLKIIHSDNGYERDWRGLATLTEQRSLCEANNINSNDPLHKVIQLWCENKPATATFGNLLTFLGLIDRWHVIEDMEENFMQDFRNHQQSTEQQVTPAISQQLQTNETELSTTASEDNCSNKVVQLPDTTNSSSLTVQTASDGFTYESETKVLTSNDVQRYQRGLPLLAYDAFLLYADVDYDYAIEILQKLQNNPIYNFKFCLKDDLLFGIPFEHIALMELIRERCKFLIVILTKEFTKSPENRFFVNYAQALQIKQEIRKVIPLLYEDQVEVPANLAMFSRMRYNANRTDLYWSKLADSMRLLQLNEGVATFSATFQRSIVSGNRTQPRNLAIEAQNFHDNLEGAPATRNSSLSNKKGVRKRKSTVKPNRVKLRESSLKTLNEFERVSKVSSSGSSSESRGILRKIFCCR